YRGRRSATRSASNAHTPAHGTPSRCAHSVPEPRGTSRSYPYPMRRTQPPPGSGATAYATVGRAGTSAAANFGPGTGDAAGGARATPGTAASGPTSDSSAQAAGATAPASSESGSIAATGTSATVVPASGADAEQRHVPDVEQEPVFPVQALGQRREERGRQLADLGAVLADQVHVLRLADRVERRRAVREVRVGHQTQLLQEFEGPV